MTNFPAYSQKEMLENKYLYIRFISCNKFIFTTTLHLMLNLKPWKFLHQQILLFINEIFSLFHSNFISLHDIFLFDYIFFSYYIIHLMFLLLVDLWYWLECFRWLNVFLRMYTLIIYFWYTLIFYSIRIEMLFFI